LQSVMMADVWWCRSRTEIGAGERRGDTGGQRGRRAGMRGRGRAIGRGQISKRRRWRRIRWT